MTDSREIQADQPQTLTIEQQTLDIFSESREVLNRGRKLFGPFREIPQPTYVQDAVRELGSAQLAGLVIGEPEDVGTGEIIELERMLKPGVGGERSALLLALHTLARPQYTAKQSQALSRLLQDRKVSARRKVGAERLAIVVSRVGVESEALAADAGIFDSADVDWNGSLKTIPDDPENANRFDAINYWRIKPFGSKGPDHYQQVELHVEDRAQ